MPRALFAPFATPDTRRIRSGVEDLQRDVVVAAESRPAPTRARAEQFPARHHRRLSEQVPVATFLPAPPLSPRPTVSLTRRPVRRPLFPATSRNGRWPFFWRLIPERQSERRPERRKEN